MLPSVFLWLSLLSFTRGNLDSNGRIIQYAVPSMPSTRPPSPTSQRPARFLRPETNHNDAAWMHYGETTPSFFSTKDLPLQLKSRPRLHIMPEYPSLIDYYPTAVIRRPKKSPQRKGSAKQRLRSSKQWRRLRPGRTRRPPRRRRNVRKKRYMYEDVYDWDYEATELDYELEEKSEVEKFLDKWHEQGMKLVGILCVFMTCFCTCCCVCRAALRSLCNSCAANCQACGDRLRCRDPNYRKFCKAAGPFGLKMSYSDYKKLKGHYEEYAFNKYGQDAPKI